MGRVGSTRPSALNGSMPKDGSRFASYRAITSALLLNPLEYVPRQIDPAGAVNRKGNACRFQLAAAQVSLLHPKASVLFQIYTCGEELLLAK